MNIQKLIDINVPCDQGHPLVACFHPYQASIFCHTKNGVIQYDTNSGFMLSRFPLGSVQIATTIAAGHDKTGNVFVGCSSINATTDVYNCNRGYLQVQYPPLIDQPKPEDVGLVAFCSSDKAFCTVSSTGTYTAHAHELTDKKDDEMYDCDHSTIRRKVAVSTMAGSPCSCSVAIGTKEGIIHIWGTGNEDDERNYAGKLQLQFCIDGYACQRASDARLSAKPNITNIGITALAWHPHLDGIIAFSAEDGRVVLFSIPRTFFIANANVGEGAEVIDIVLHPTEPITIILVRRNGLYYLDILMRNETLNPQKDVELSFAPITSVELSELIDNVPSGTPRLLCHSSQNRVALYFPNGRLLTYQILDYRIGRPIDGLHATNVSCPPQCFIKGVTKDLMSPSIHPAIVYYVESSEQMRNRSANYLCYLKAKPITASFSHILCRIPATPDIKDKKVAKKFSQLRVCKVMSSVDGKSVMVCFHCQLGTGSNSTQMLVSLIDLSKDNAYAAIYKEPEGSLRRHRDEEDTLIEQFPPVTPCRDAYPIGGPKYIVLTTNKEKVHIVESAELELQDLLASKKKKKEKKKKDKKHKHKKGEKGEKDDDPASTPQEQEDTDILGGLDFGSPDPNLQSSSGLDSTSGLGSSVGLGLSGGEFASTAGGGEEGEEDVGGTNVKLLHKAENIFPTPFTSKDGTVMMYSVYNEISENEGLMWLVYSKNKKYPDMGLPEGYQMLDINTDADAGICLGHYRFVHQVVWQKTTEPNEIPLIAVVTENKLLIIRSDNNTIILEHSISHTFVPVWYGYTVLIPQEGGQIDYITCQGNVHYLCTLDYYTSGHSIVGVFPDRLVYGSRTNHLSLQRIVQRGLVPTEALILGVLDAPEGIVPDGYLLDVIKRYCPRSTESGSEGPGPNMGISPDLLYGLLKAGHPDYAYLIARSGDNVSIFRHLPQIPSVVKAVLCTYVHEWKEAFYELLADKPTIQEGLKGMENAQLFTSTLPHPQSDLCNKIRSLASNCIAAGEFELARWCYDLVGDEWELLLLIVSQTKLAKPLIEQVMRRSHNKLVEVYLTACALLEKKKDLKSKKEQGPLDLPIRNQTLITIDKTTKFPNWPVDNSYPKPMRLEAPAEKLQTVGPELILDTISSWIGALKPLEKELDEDEEAAEGGLDLGPTIGIEGEDTVVGYWRCDEDDTEKPNKMLLDTSKFTNHGTIIGLYSYIECDAPVDPGDPTKVKKQSSLYIGVNGEEKGEGYISFPFKERSTLALGYGEKSTKRAGFTFELWVKKDLDTEQTLLLRGKKDKPIWKVTTVGTEFSFTTAKGTISTQPKPKQSEEEDESNFPVGKWVHIAITLDTQKEVPHVRLLSNGNVCGEGDLDYSGDEALPEKDDGLYLGLQFQGLVTEVRYWATSRSPEDIQDFKDTHLDMAEARKKIQVAIHPRNCTCEKCTKRREAMGKGIRLTMDGDKDKEKDKKKIKKTRRGQKKDEEAGKEATPAPPAEKTA